MSSGVCGNDNTTTSYNLSYTLQSACSITLDGNIERMRKESNQSNEHEQSGQSSESNKCICDPGSNATCTCTGAPTIDRSAIGHTSFPCAHCRDHDNTNSLSAASDYIERDYAEYIAATSAKGQDTSTGIWNSIESRNFKQTNADSAGSIERCTGIPAGVTV